MLRDICVKVSSNTVSVGRLRASVQVNDADEHILERIGDQQDTTVVVSQGTVIQVTGRAGPMGKTGGGVEGFDFTQATPADTWVIHHQLGYKPTVNMWDSGGNEMVAQVLHVSVNQTVIYFNQPVAGQARLI